jgi:uncharacterized protein (DUF362 family)
MNGPDLPKRTDNKDSDKASAVPPANQSYQPHSMTRREVITRGLGVGAALGAFAYFTLAPENAPGSRKDSTGLISQPKVEPKRIQDFSVAAPYGNQVLGIGRNGGIEELLRKALDGIGGIQRYIQPGDTVLIKPNVAFDRSPNLGATSSPEILKALIHLLLVDCRAREVRVADNPIESPADCFAKSGISRAAGESGGKIFLPDSNAFEVLHTPGATLIENWPFFYRPFRDINKVIGLAAVKDHNLCHASMGIKNWYGLLGGKRNTFHQDIHEIIADLSMLIKPTFTILDGTRVLMANGPTGGDPDLVKKGEVILATTDQVTADAWAFEHLLERGTNYPDYLYRAEKRGSGKIHAEGRMKEII